MVQRKSKLIGQTGTDKLTGFKGKITGHAQYLFGEDRILIINPSTVESGKLNEEHWIDLTRFEIDPS